MTALAVEGSRPVISGWSAVSPYGIGRDAFTEGVRAGRPTATALTDTEWNGPDERACLVPGFTVRDALGRKGTRSMDRVTGLAVTAVGRLLGEGAGPGAGPVPDGSHVGLVLGTNTGSAQSMMDFTRDTFTEEKPYHVDPSRFPNTVMNCAAGQCAIRYGLKGPNATVAAGRASGLKALGYGRRLLMSARARSVLCGAVEEYSEARSWLEHRTRRADEPAAVLGEGCAMVRLQPGDAVADGEALADLLCVESAVTGAQDVTGTLTRCVRRALERTRVDPAEVWAVAPSEPVGPAGPAEREALARLFPDDPRWLSQGELIGDTSAASAAFQIVSVLALAQDSPAASGRVAAITSVDRDGAVAVVLLRLR
ncbi:beta-ketoacyl synthase N-terminal-like domain-containing protein [Streptomyces sp. FXJ1.172]|uniref:beta-ketoacyl synthase N-terminal-like domain-containing protein n=1 Tax=Streptomyces sp. FXJ1.172 TaxID=710705 RepID=UPI000A4E3C2E|nr:beta-ketoacyl synthase N-terminal-like domain-containing protein [Streptomyces sp. FXJ1.172]WEO94722.1 beta-ketoacyl synthase N-terminal-like domain-containing protein [Streptomyces sp. FXJ1.172]